MADLNELGIAEARDAMRKGEASSRDITQACLDAIDGAKALNASCHDTAEQAMAMADQADQKRKAGSDEAMLGIPVAVKDLFCTKGIASQASSRILDGFKPAYESSVTQNLWDR
ncbi:MAG: amidase family protein, partial [Pseudomonadota bacterium]